MLRPTSALTACLVVLGLCAGAAAQPDVTCSDTMGIFKWGTVGGITAYSMSVTACNVGDEPVSWVANTNQHPVVAQNIYRVREGLLEQIGMSWLKHTFCALSQGDCGACQPTNCLTLGVACASSNSGTSMGDQSSLGPRSDVNPSTGAFSFPFPTAGQYGDAVFKRCQVRIDDLDPALNPGALYFTVIQYVAPDEPAFGTHFNNASARPIAVGPFIGGGYELIFSGPTMPQTDPIQAWADIAGGVERVTIDTPEVEGSGRLVLGARVEHLGAAAYRYQYAIYNGTSERGARSFSVPLPGGVTISELHFHDVEYHSGEPFSPGDWSPAIAGGAITWSTLAYSQDPNANALRWGTTYSFSFEADAPPQPATAQLELFKTGPGNAVTVETIGPAPVGPPFLRGDCNDDGAFNIGDAVSLLGNLFGVPGPGACGDACDSNDDGAENIADAVHILSALFVGGALPPPPHPGCGADPTTDPLGCSGFSGCP